MIYIKVNTVYDDDTPVNHDIWMKWINKLSEETIIRKGNCFNTFGFIKNSKNEPKKIHIFIKI